MITSQTELTNNPHLLVLLQGGGATLSVQWPISPVDVTNPSWDRNGLNLFITLLGSPLGVKCHDHTLCQISNTHTGINHSVIFLQDPGFFVSCSSCRWAVSQQHDPSRSWSSWVRSSCLWASALPAAGPSSPTTTVRTKLCCADDLYKSVFHARGSQFGPALSLSVTVINYSLLPHS